MASMWFLCFGFVLFFFFFGEHVCGPGLHGPFRFGEVPVLCVLHYMVRVGQ